MRRLLLLLLLVAASLAAVAVPARAESWVFRRSYYTHEPAGGVRVGPVPAPRPVYARHWGGYFRGGYRHVHATTHVGGTHDHLHLFHSWGQFGEQH